MSTNVGATETLIVWQEPGSGVDMALSFQEAEGCAMIWFVPLNSRFPTSNFQHPTSNPLIHHHSNAASRPNFQFVHHHSNAAPLPTVKMPFGSTPFRRPIVQKPRLYLLSERQGEGQARIDRTNREIGRRRFINTVQQTLQHQQTDTGMCLLPS